MWVEALLGRNLVDGEPVTAEDILDKTMDIYLGVKVSETSGKSFNRIKDVIVQGARPGAHADPGARGPILPTPERPWATRGASRPRGWPSRRRASSMRIWTTARQR
jgi:hypothetical protein